MDSGCLCLLNWWCQPEIFSCTYQHSKQAKHFYCRWGLLVCSSTIIWAKQSVLGEKKETDSPTHSYLPMQLLWLWMTSLHYGGMPGYSRDGLSFLWRPNSYLQFWSKFTPRGPWRVQSSPPQVSACSEHCEISSHKKSLKRQTDESDW